MNPKNRDYFDQQVEWVMERLPQSVLDLLQEVPLHVEDQPSPSLMQQLAVSDADELCGFFTGVPFTEGVPFMGNGGYLPSELPIQNTVTIYRRGIVAVSRDERGKVPRCQLRRQIRITILHELAHLHGMGEEEIEKLGYG